MEVNGSQKGATYTVLEVSIMNAGEKNMHFDIFDFQQLLLKSIFKLGEKFYVLGIHSNLGIAEFQIFLHK